MPQTLPNSIHSLPRNVVFFVYDGMQPIDLAGPLQTFSTANGIHGAAYRTSVLSVCGEMVIAAGSLALGSAPWTSMAEPIDTLVVPGGPGVDVALKDPTVLKAIQSLSAGARRICSVCTGAFLLAECGLLDGRTATTHWRSAEKLASRYPAVRVDATPIYVRDGNTYTSAGVTAGIDLALALIEEDNGGPCATAVAKRLVVHMRRPGGQAQFSDAMRLQMSSAAAFSPLLSSIASRPSHQWTVDEMAALAGQSVRTFYRKFVEEAGMPPSTMLERIRVEHASVLLRTTTVSIKEVVRRSGFASDQAMRRAFVRTLGILPSSLSRLTRERMETDRLDVS